MKAIPFNEMNTEVAQDQSQYITLPALVDDGAEGCVISCWRLNWWERIRMIFTGRIWVGLHMYGEDVTPIWMTTYKDELIKPQEADKGRIGK